MHYLLPQDHEIKPTDRSVDPGKVSPLNRIAFAVSAAQAAFGHTYIPPSEAGFVDRSPDEIATIRATMLGGMK